MLLRNKGSQETYHAPSSVGKALINAGLAEEVLPQVKKVGTAKWSAQLGRFIQDFECPPIVLFSCDVCGSKGYTESRKGTAHEAVARHCGIAESCPADVAEAYSKLFSQWKAKSKSNKQPKETVSPSTPKHLLIRAGVKTKEEL